MEEYDFFLVEDEDEEIPVPVPIAVPVKAKIPKIKIEKPKSICPYCKKGFTNLDRHIDNCKSKPIEISSKLEAKLDSVLNLALIGKHHILTDENILLFAKNKGKIKKYECYWVFLPSDSIEISDKIDSLRNDGNLNKIAHNWYVITKKGKNHLENL